MAKAAFNKHKNLSNSKLDSNSRKQLQQCDSWSIALYGVEIWTLRRVDQKYLESSKMWFWRRMGIILTDRLRNEEVLHKVKGRN